MASSVVPDVPDYVASGEEARLIPVLADKNRERRAASVFLATLSAVDDFAAAMLGGVGVRLGSRAKVRCFTEVVFRDVPSEVKHRPDGLIVVDTGRKTWRALLEAKIGKAGIDREQLEAYAELARLNGVDAVITLSNQFTALPEHHPVPLPKAVVKGLGVYHWSWMHVLTQATLLLHDDDFDSPDQRYILREVVRHFRHESAGVSQFDRMNASWKDLVTKVQTEAPLRRDMPEVEESVASWHQEERDLSLIMARKIGREVRLKLSRAHVADQAARLRDDCDELVATRSVSSTLDIPDAAAPLVVTAHLGRRTLTCSMSLPAPKDRKRASARINWLLKQLAGSDPADVFIKVNWPGRAPDTHASLADARANAACLEAENPDLAPIAFDVLMVRDLAARFSGARTFIEGLEDFVPRYYENIGQRLRAWVAAPPKVIQAVDREVESTTTVGPHIGDTEQPPAPAAATADTDSENPAGEPASGVYSPRDTEPSPADS